MSISREQWQSISPLLAEAMELPEAAREAWLGDLDTTQPTLAPLLRTLLAADRRAGQAQAFETVSILVGSVGSAGAAWQAGQRVGPYELSRLLGRGGMGEVWLARQVEGGITRDVALKLPVVFGQAGLWRERFRRERDILARLQHPNIATLLDAGVADLPGGIGQPYLAMEYVQGAALAEHATQAQLGVRERLALFRQVLAAVGQAHRRLVIHRDIKPSNILVTPEGQVKLLDFGIAKLIEGDGHAPAADDLTRLGGRMLTIRYAAPEQVQGDSLGTATDIYALGVVLHELLTGQSPYRRVRAGESLGAADIQREEFQLPSSLDRQAGLKGDLDAILLKALRRDPAERYGTVEQFDDDLQRHLDRRPVLARIGSRRYRAGRFIARYRLPIAAAAAVLASLLVGLVVADRERRAAVAAQARAEHHFASVHRLSNTLISDLYGEIVSLPGAMKARTRLVETGLAYLDELAKESGGDVDLQVDLATAYMKLGDIQGGQNGNSGGDSKLALESYRRAHALLEQAQAGSPGNAKVLLGLARSSFLQARLLLVTGGPAAAIGPAERAVKFVELVPEAAVGDYELAHARSISYWTLGDALSGLQKTVEAMRAYDKMIAVNEAYAARHRDDINGLELLRNGYNNLAIAIIPGLSANAAMERTMALMQKSIAVSERLLVLAPGSPDHEMRLAEQRYNMGDALLNAGRFSAAIEPLRLADPVISRAAGDAGDHRANLAKGMIDAALARALSKAGPHDAAAQLFGLAESRLRTLLKADPDNLVTRFVLAQVEIHRGSMFADLAVATADVGKRGAYWRRAHENLATGVTRMREVNERYPLAGAERAVLDEGLAALAKAQAALPVPPGDNQPRGVAP